MSKLKTKANRINKVYLKKEKVTVAKVLLHVLDKHGDWLSDRRTRRLSLMLRRLHVETMSETTIRSDLMIDTSD